MAERHVAVVGGGIIGLAVARRLLQTHPGVQVTVLEKEHEVAAHQSGRNSGVVHAGLYYTPGSLKALLCRRGVALLREYCAQHGIRYDECGKVVVALDSPQRRRLDDIHRRAAANGVPGLARLGPRALADIEPHVRGVEALHSPTTAIVDYPQVCRSLAQDITASGGRVLLGAAVTGMAVTGGGGVRVRTSHPAEPVLTADALISCAGLHSDRVAQMSGASPAPRIVPFRGEYYLLRPEFRRLVRGLIYPVPDPRYPFLGIHLTRRIDGEVLVGPNAILAFTREGYRRRDVDLPELAETLRYPGFLRLAAAHWRTGLHEMLQSASRRAFITAARRYVPDLRPAHVRRGPAGIRAQAIDRSGALVDDFRIERHGPLVHLRNAPSPGATSSLAIAEHLVRQITI